MDTTAVGNYKVTIGSDDYTKRVMQIRNFLCTDYSVIRIQANGKRVSARLNQNTHRHAIRRIEAALAAKQAA
jgi:hypothetical protein